MKRLTTEEIKLLSPEAAEWIFNEAEKKHNDLIRVETSITERGYKLFGTYFIILTAALGYVLTHLRTPDDLPLTAGCASIIVFTSIAIGYIYQVIKPHLFFAPGKEPDNFNIPDYLDYFKMNPLLNQKSQFICDELVAIQIKITRQKQLNERRTGYTTRSLQFLVLGSFLAVISFILAFFIV